MNFKTKTTEELINYCKKLYKSKGISSLTYTNISSSLYYGLYARGITLSKLIKKLNLEKEYVQFKESQHIWSWEKILSECKPIVEKNGFLPPAQWFQTNSKSSLVYAVYKLNKTWGDLREHFKSYENSTFVKSRNNKRWLSHAEASLSNFLYTRGIKHKKGRKYPKEYADKTGMKYGVYDLEFIDKNNNLVLIEVWGEKPFGHQQKQYEYKKKLKEEYNKNNKNFIGINFRDCYNEKKLELILKSHIGIIKPFIFEQPFDDQIPSTNWSNADELILFCKEFAKKQSGGVFPTEEWLRKRGKWKNRKGEAHNTLSIYIKTWIGGMRKLREIIGQPENSTIKWTKEKVLAEYLKFYKKYQLTPGTVRTRFRRKQINITKEEVLFAQNLDHASLKYFGSTAKICKLLNIREH